MLQRLRLTVVAHFVSDVDCEDRLVAVDELDLGHVDVGVGLVVGVVVKVLDLVEVLA